MERQVGEVIDIKLKVVEIDKTTIGKCQECFYRGFDECFEEDTEILCYPHQRHDNRNVIFLKV